MNIQSLTASERILLAETLWDSLLSEDTEIALTEPQKIELDCRLAAFEIDQEDGSSWSVVKSRILTNK